MGAEGLDMIGKGEGMRRIEANFYFLNRSTEG